MDDSLIESMLLEENEKENTNSSKIFAKTPKRKLFNISKNFLDEPPEPPTPNKHRRISFSSPFQQKEIEQKNAINSVSKKKLFNDTLSTDDEQFFIFELKDRAKCSSPKKSQK